MIYDFVATMTQCNCYLFDVLFNWNFWSLETRGVFSLSDFILLLMQLFLFRQLECRQRLVMVCQNSSQRLMRQLQSMKGY